MTVAELRKFIENLPDDMEVGGSGHFGEKLECWSISTESVSLGRFQPKSETILCISIESPGPDPE